MEDFVEIGGGDAWVPQAEGDSVTGTYTGVQEDVGPNKSKLYDLMTADGPVSVWGSTVLDQKMSRIQTGYIVRITFTGLSKEKGKFGKPWKTFRVEARPGAGAPAPAPQQENGELDESELGY